MNNKYKVNNIFNDDGIIFNDLITKTILSFIEQDISIMEDNE